MKALVTGGAGFIGSNLVRLLVSEGHEVTVLDSLLSGHRENLEPFPSVRFVQGDIRNGELLQEVVPGNEVIFHLAASVGNKRSIDMPLDDADINVMGTLNVLEAARKARVRKIVASSSAGVFGELKTLPIKEDHPIEPDSPYGATKLCAEKQCLAYSKIHDIQAVCLRYFNVYGVNQRFDLYGNVIPIFAHRMLAREPITIYGDGEQTRDFVNVRDVAMANYLASKTDRSGVYNLGSGTRITINNLVSLMEDASGIKAERIYGAPRPGDVLHSLADISKARSEFGFSPVERFEDGLKRYFEWLAPTLAAVGR